MSNQYCKITSWIQHHKDHGDAKYAEAILDLCLDSWLKPNKYNGLTFLYQTNKTIRKKFCESVFTPNSRDACEDFKRYIIPDIFHSCEDFQKKDVGNVLGYKYEIKSCDKNKVVFENGMEIHALLDHNSFESLSPNLKDIVKIYYVVKGEPAESGEPYRVPHRKREKKAVGGGIEGLRRLNATKDIFSNLLTMITSAVITKDLCHMIIGRILSEIIILRRVFKECDNILLDLNNVIYIIGGMDNPLHIILICIEYICNMVLKEEDSNPIYEIAADLLNLIIFCIKRPNMATKEIEEQNEAHEGYIAKFKSFIENIRSMDYTKYKTALDSFFEKVKSNEPVFGKKIFDRSEFTERHLELIQSILSTIVMSKELSITDLINIKITRCLETGCNSFFETDEIARQALLAIPELLSTIAHPHAHAHLDVDVGNEHFELAGELQPKGPITASSFMGHPDPLSNSSSKKGGSGNQTIDSLFG
jgi:hypothetical protein